MKNTLIAIRNWHKTFSVREQIKRHDLLGRWITIIVVIALALVICSQTLTHSFKRIVELGPISSKTHLTPFPFTFVDPDETARLRRLEKLGGGP